MYGSIVKKLDVDSLLEVVVNVALVLTGVRPAYRLDASTDRAIAKMIAEM